MGEPKHDPFPQPRGAQSSESNGCRASVLMANSAWTNGTVERIMREVIHGAKSMFNDGRRPLSEWVVVLPAVQ